MLQIDFIYPTQHCSTIRLPLSYFLFERFQAITIFYYFGDKCPYFWSHIRYDLGTISYRTGISTLKNVSFPNVVRDSLIDFKYVIHKVINYVKTCKFRWLNSEYFYDELKMIHLFLEAHKTMICSRNKQFLMLSHEDS